MVFSVDRGEVYVGSEAAIFLGIEEDSDFEILGGRFYVRKRLSPTGSIDDIKVYGHLKDIQNLLGLEGKINEIKALECLCLIETGQTELDALSLAKAQLAEILPEGKVILLKGIADVREKQRATMEGFLGLLVPIVIFASGASIGILSMLNVRERYEEIGVLRAIGFGSTRIASIFLTRALLLGFLGAFLGFLAGGYISLELGPSIFSLTAGAISLDWSWLGWLFILTPAFTAVAAFIPTVSAVTWDPFHILNYR
jgi:ABC-type antimicrobial peptide transport system permease subunit